MDRIYRNQRHVYDLTRRYYLFGRDRLLQQLCPPPGGHVLEIGCGTARNLIAAQRRYPAARFYGLDISYEMLDTAAAALRRAGLDERIRLAHADATRFDPAILFGRPNFSRIFMSYSLSMIPDWERALDEAVSWLFPGGELHIVDFGRQASLPGPCRTALRRWLSWFHVQPRDELEQVLRRRTDAECASFHTLPLDYACHAVVRRRGEPVQTLGGLSTTPGVRPSGVPVL
jgi:S-adenosylmethionine-diacylgycerolhomoserine-N-methlytransferase